MTDFNLSEKEVRIRINDGEIGYASNCFYKGDVKQAVKLLKENLKKVQFQYNKGHGLRNIFNNIVKEINKILVFAYQVTINIIMLINVGILHNTF